MGRTVKLSRVGSALAELTYPVEREAAAEALSDVTLLLADGEANLGGVVADCPSESFDHAADLEEELHATLPREAVGEPYQAEGEG